MTVRTILLLGLAACDVVFPTHAHDPDAPDGSDIAVTISVDEPVFLSTKSEIRVGFAGSRDMNYAVTAPGALGEMSAGTEPSGGEVKIPWTAPAKMEDATVSATASYGLLASPEARTFDHVVPVLQRVGHFFEQPAAGMTTIGPNDALAVHFVLLDQAKLYLAGAQIVPTGTSRRFRFSIYGDNAQHIPTSARASSETITTSGPETTITATFSNVGTFERGDYWIVLFCESTTAIRNDNGTSEAPPARVAAFAFPAAGQPANFPISSTPHLEGIALFAGFGAATP